MRSLANYDFFLMPKPFEVGKRIIDMIINTKRIIDDQYRGVIITIIIIIDNQHRGAAEEMLSFQAQLSRRLAAEMMVRQQVLSS